MLRATLLRAVDALLQDVGVPLLRPVLLRSVLQLAVTQPSRSAHTVNRPGPSQGGPGQSFRATGQVSAPSTTKYTPTNVEKNP